MKNKKNYISVFTNICQQIYGFQKIGNDIAVDIKLKNEHTNWYVHFVQQFICFNMIN